jgi:hypothetical protein
LNLLVLGNAVPEPVEVEVVLDEVVVDLAEEVVVLKSAEPLYPPHVDVLAELRLFTHINYIAFELFEQHSINHFRKANAFIDPYLTSPLGSSNGPYYSI